MVSAPTLTSNFLHLETSERLNHPNKVQTRDFFFPACFVFSLAYYFMPLVLFLLISLKKAVLVAAVKEQKVRRAVFIRIENWTAHSLT